MEACHTVTTATATLLLVQWKPVTLSLLHYYYYNGSLSHCHYCYYYTTSSTMEACHTVTTVTATTTLLLVQWKPVTLSLLLLLHYY